MNLGNTIRNRRKQLKISQKELARLMECGSSLVCKWESGKIIPNFEQIQKLEVLLSMGVLSEEFCHRRAIL
ncbi:helix-turn-helix domain-containing protein [Candidatus Uabimicrobium amorphum]|uniref:HTH cro/C1-type domain-containing protein n=1 Tax=Uabimicrobium amorphum TaxID=2596890 RepID=A0A5S9F4G5_UABAM|nr:helix-turn-helix transcriptional regulator [Candidatus Uabimicrobium amorphum]BBM84454.1 hypothetical protein UABAM_02814 [Candidatus Uabimicrobium amorphum]